MYQTIQSSFKPDFLQDVEQMFPKNPLILQKAKAIYSEHEFLIKASAPQNASLNMPPRRFGLETFSEVFSLPSLQQKNSDLYARISLSLGAYDYGHSMVMKKVEKRVKFIKKSNYNFTRQVLEPWPVKSNHERFLKDAFETLEWTRMYFAYLMYFELEKIDDKILEPEALTKKEKYEEFFLNHFHKMKGALEKDQNLFSKNKYDIILKIVNLLEKNQ